MFALVNETRRFMGLVGLDLNKEKSATNSETSAQDAKHLKGIEGYKYLGIVEDRSSRLSTETFERIRAEQLDSVERLCKTKLNGKNLMRAINEYAISLANYYVGMLKLESDAFARLDKEVR